MTDEKIYIAIYFGFSYPKPTGVTHNCTVENLFSLSKYKEAFTKAFENEDGFTSNSKSVSKIVENITENAKKNLSFNSKDFDVADFYHFKPIFALITKMVKNCKDGCDKNAKPNPKIH